MEVKVYNIEGKETGKKVKLNTKVFGVEPNEHAVYLAVKQHMAKKRQGTHKTKERNEIKGSTKKIKRQKGTGTARAGDIKNPIFRGGGRAFGPKPRTYNMKVNKKLKALARKSVLSDKAKNNKIIILDDIKFEEPKTNKLYTMLKNFELDNKKSVIVLSEQNKNIYLSSQNLQNVKVVTNTEIATYDILNASTLFMVESSLDYFNKLDLN